MIVSHAACLVLAAKNNFANNFANRSPLGHGVLLAGLKVSGNLDVEKNNVVNVEKGALENGGLYAFKGLNSNKRPSYQYAEAIRAAARATGTYTTVLENELYADFW